MLGGFTIISDDKRVTEQIKRSSKTWKLLQYLITHRHKSVSQEELIDVFCEGDQLSNPGSALRTMVYRARAALSDSGLPCADEMIIAKSGGYSWNNAVRCDVDVEEFEALCNKAGADVAEEERIELLLRASKLYRGDFLPNSAGEMWVMPIARWYRFMYTDCAHNVLELLIRHGRSIEAEELCAKAMSIDPFDEKTLEYRLRSLLVQGKNMEALEEYKRMETMFYDVMGVNFSDNLRELYSHIQRPAIREEITLERVLKEWLEDADFPGAYYCDLSEFKTMVQIESRSVPRSGRTAYIVRFDTKHEPGEKGSEAMKQLGMAIPGTLRMGDLFTRSSPGQYMLMLHSLTFEDCRTLINRIMHKIDAKYLPKIISTSIMPVIPTE